MFFRCVFVTQFFNTFFRNILVRRSILYLNDERVALQWKRKIKFNKYPCFLTENVVRFSDMHTLNIPRLNEKCSDCTGIYTYTLAFVASPCIIVQRSRESCLNRPGTCGAYRAATIKAVPLPRPAQSRSPQSYEEQRQCSHVWWHHMMTFMTRNLMHGTPTCSSRQLRPR